MKLTTQERLSCLNIPQNYDSQEVLPSIDSTTAFYLGKSSADRQEALRQLLFSWRPEPARHDPKELSQHMQEPAHTRLTHVASWIASNIARFQADNADIRALRREFEALSEILKANAQPCLMECSVCRLPCLLIKSHELQDHDCSTSHKCLEVCEFIDDHDELDDDQESCGLPYVVLS